MVNWSIQQSRDLYNIDHWSQGYFDINDRGELCVTLKKSSHTVEIPLLKLTKDIEAMGLQLPTLVRFIDILKDRLDCLQAAFQQAIKNYHYQNSYIPVYPIKVNQQRHVVETFVNHRNDQMGLEAGSKSELMVVLAYSKIGSSIIICNGYKDRDYIRLALIAKRLGHQIYIVIEKQRELELILEECMKLEVQPLLGIRVRLSSIGAGKWQNTGGERSKFGLSATQVLAVIQRLQQTHYADSLKLLHFHMGSQIPNIRDIQKGLKEAARYFAELWSLGIFIDSVDVGGGLGIDYEGTRSRRYCSVNYTLMEYAQSVVGAFNEICKKNNLPVPKIITESGRAMTAHHAVLITHILEAEIFDNNPSVIKNREDIGIIKQLWTIFETITEQSLTETYYNACHYLNEVQAHYLQGLLTLTDRARAEQIYLAICLKVKKLLKPEMRAHREILDELREKLADKYFCNFSLFQSMPDIWAFKQVFPIMPLVLLDQLPTRQGIIEDLTCDSDGRIDTYIEGDGIGSTLALPEVKDTQNYVGFFLVGAYQETLGDRHNLFGKTNSVNIAVSEEGNYHIITSTLGEKADAILSDMNYSPEFLLEIYKNQLNLAPITEVERSLYLKELIAGLNGYTYLTIEMPVNCHHRKEVHKIKQQYSSDYFIV